MRKAPGRVRTLVIARDIEAYPASRLKSATERDEVCAEGRTSKAGRAAQGLEKVDRSHQVLWQGWFQGAARRIVLTSLRGVAESDQLVDELITADVLVIGTPLYNFGMPAALKAWIDQIVRPGRTVEVDESKLPDPYVPLLADRPRHAVLLSARCGIGFGPGGEMAHMNHQEPNLVTALNFIGITRIHQIAIEGQETGGEVLAASVAEALREVDALVMELQSALDAPPLHARERQVELNQV